LLGLLKILPFIVGWLYNFKIKCSKFGIKYILLKSLFMSELSVFIKPLKALGIAIARKWTVGLHNLTLTIGRTVK
jgi:hypothetical protein